MKYRLLLLLFVCCQYAFAQKVALVLSGGGAKGLAHVGALKALEENNIPIDCITGTSMGALVGGFYAAGYSTEEILSLGLSKDLQDWVKNIPKSKYSYLQKEDDFDPSWLTLKFSIDSSFSATLGTTLSEDYILNFALAKEFASATKLSKSNFDNLFVPYRATASEIFTEQEVILSSGNLFEAARASMAVPFFYRPVRINNRLLFDGGIYNNFPVKTAKEAFHPDVVIGINVASKKMQEYPYDKDNNLIAESLLFAILDKTDSTEISDNGVFIDVELENFNALDFNEAKNIIELGYNSTMRKMEEIKTKIKRRVSDDELKEKREAFSLKSDEILFDSIAIKGFKKNQFRYITGRFDNTNPISFDKIEDGYNKIVSDDYFANIFPSYSFTKKNTFTLSGNPNPKLRGKIGGSLTSRNTSQLFVGFDFKRLTRVLSHYSLGIHTGRFYQSVNIKSKVQFPGKLELSIKPEFIYNHWNFTSITDLFSPGVEPEIQDSKDLSYGINFEFPIRERIKFNFHTSYFKNRDKFSNNSILVSSDTLDVLKLTGSKIQGKIYFNSLNLHQYPSKGQKLNLFANYIFSNENYSAGNTSNINSIQNKRQNWYKVGLEAEKYMNPHKFYSLGISFTSIYSNQPTFGSTRSTVLSQASFNPLQDSRTLVLGNFRGRKYMTMGIKNVFHLNGNFQFRVEGYAIYHFEKLSIDTENQPYYFTSKKINFSGTTGLVYQSLIGPISLSLNYYDQQNRNWSGLLHIGYLLFNKKSLD
ncbi:patatin-like phospholipase family protein [Reichenbachiella sp. MALMAid0571]|uniref:patatin-like phospholipase family protein n=1 Tax=Reichenbachiella sp. MALMAid0571 TaxID=3143939 RepID=UPI0032DEF1FF